MTQPASYVEEVILRLEKQLIDLAFRRDPSKVAARLAPGFQEFG
jgi:hypothetical protein